MTSPLEHLDARIDSGCLAEECSRPGCAVGLEGIPDPYRLIDLDHPDSPARANATRCDYLFIGEADGGARLHIVPLELKSSGIRVGTVSSRLQAGARIAERIVPGASSIRFVPVAASGGKLHRQQMNELARSANRVPFRGERYSIRLIRCGEPLSKAL